MNPYEILGVSQGADRLTIKQAYRRLCFQYHPDKAGQTNEAHTRFVRVQEAYTFLCNNINNGLDISEQTIFVQNRASKKDERQDKERKGDGGTTPGSSPETPFTNVEFRSQIQANEIIQRVIGHLEGVSDVSKSLYMRYERYSSMVGDKTWSLPEYISKNIQGQNIRAQELLQQVMAMPEDRWKYIPEVVFLLGSIYLLKDNASEMRGKLHVLERTMRALELATGREIHGLKQLFQLQAARW